MTVFGVTGAAPHRTNATSAPRLDRLGRSLEATVLFGLYAVPLTIGWTVAGVHIAAGLAAVAALLLGILRGRWLVRRTPADLAMVAFALACIVSTCASDGRTESFITLRKLLLLPLVHLAAGALGTLVRVRTALRLFVFGIAATALVAMLRFFLHQHAADARLRSTGHYMTFAGLLLVAWPLAAGAATAARGWIRATYIASLPVFGAALLLGFTRGAWIGSVVAGIAMLARRRPRWALAAPVVAVAVLLVLPPAYRARALSSFDPHHPTNIERESLWRAGVAIWKDHPWVGVGLIDLGPVLRNYLPSTERRIHGHLHDNWIHVAATLGSLGLLAFAWLMSTFGRIAWRAGGRGAGGEVAGLGLGIWGAFWGFQLMGLFEWNFGDVEVTIALCFLLGAGLAAAPTRAADRLPSVGEASRGVSA